VPGGHISLNENKAHQIQGVFAVFSWPPLTHRKPLANDVKTKEFIEQRAQIFSLSRHHPMIQHPRKCMDMQILLLNCLAQQFSKEKINF